MADNSVIGIRITGDASGLQQSLQGAGRDVQGFATRTKEASEGVGALANGLKSAFIGSSIAVGIIQLKNTLADMTSAMVQAQIQADKLRNGLNFAVGRGNSAQELEFIRNTTRTLGIEFAGASSQYTKLAAAARGTAMEGAGVRKVFEGLSQASTVMGMSALEAEGAMRSVVQMMSKGQVQAEELRGQLGEHLPGAFQIAARSMGVTTAELGKMLEAGKVVSADFLPKFIDQLSKEVAPEVDASSKSMQASVNRMSNAWTDFKRTLAEGGAGKSISGEATGLANYLTVITEAMERAKKAGSGNVGEVMAGLGTAIARSPFDALAVTANTLNGTLNLLSMGTLKLRTNLNLLPEIFETNAQKTAMLDARLGEAKTTYAALQDQLAKNPDNIYLKARTFEAYLLTKQLQDAKDAQDKLKGSNATTDGIRANGIGRQAYLDDIEKRKKLAAEAMAKYAPEAEKAQAEIDKLRESLGSAFTPELEARIRKHFVKPITDASAGIADAIAKQYALARATLDGGDKLPQSEKFRIEEEQAIDKLLKSKEITLGRALVLRRDLTKAVKEMAAAEYQAEQNKDFGQRAQDGEKEIQQLTTLVKKEQERGAEIGKTKEQIFLIKQAISEQEQAEIERQIVLEEGIVRNAELSAAELLFHTQEVARLKERLRLKKDLTGTLGDNAAKQAAADAAKLSADEWKRGWEETDKLARTVFTEWAKDGSNAAQKIGDTLKSALLSAIYEATLKPLVLQIYSGINGNDPSKAAGSLGALGSLVKDISGGIADYMASKDLLGTAGVDTYATAIEYGADAATAQALATKANTAALGNFTQNLGPALAAAAVSFQVGQSLSGGNKLLGQGSNTWTALLGGFNAGMLLKAFGQGETNLNEQGVRGTLGTQGSRVGGYYLTQQDRGWFSGDGVEGTGKNGGYTFDSALTGYMDAVIAQTSKSVKGYADALGLGAQSVDTYTKAIDVSIKDLSPEDAQKKINEALAAFGEDLAKTVIGSATAYMDTGVGPDKPSYIRAYETSQQALERLGTAIITVNGAFDNLNPALQKVGLQGAAAASDLIDAFGGLQAFSQQTASYYSNFYSKDEQAANTKRQLTTQLGALGLDLPATREAYRKLVDDATKALGTTTDDATYATLIKLSDAFASIVPASEDAVTAVDKVAKALAENNAKLQDRLDLLTGSKSARDLELRDATDESTKALLRQIYAQEGLNAANIAAATAADAAAAAAKQLAATNQGIQDQIDILTGAYTANEVALRNLTDASTRDLTVKLQAAQAQSDLLREQEALAQKAQAAADQLASTNASLQDRLDVLTGTQTDRSIQLRDAAEESTKSLLRQIFAQEDVRAASDAFGRSLDEIAQSARAAAEQLKATNAGLQDRLDVLLGKQTDRTLQLRDATDATTKSLLQQIFAQEDLKAIGEERAGLQQQLDELTLSSAEKIAKQHDALDESNRALFDQVQAQQSLADASKAAATAAQEAASKFNSAMDSLSSRNQSLQVQYLTAQGNVGGASALQRQFDLAGLTQGVNPADIASITAAYDKNLGLEAKIKEIEAANAAAQAMAQAAAQAAQDAATAAKSLKDAWQSAADGIFDEVARIRGLFNTGSAGTLAAAQARFTIAGAQAAAGDQEAAKLLPTLSKTLLELAETNATSLVQLRMIQGQTANSLESIGNKVAQQYGLELPKFAAGTNYVPQDMAAIIHKGEAIIPAAYNPANGGSAPSNAEVVAELQALRIAMAALQSAADKTAGATESTAKTVNLVTRGGRAMQTETFV